MAEPRVTVLIDTYNHERFIEEAIESVLSQDYASEEMEVLVVDDGSTDGTGERVKKCGSRVQYLYKPNGGQASAFNYGFARARGEVVALLDGDDTWLPGKLQRVTQEFANHPDVGMVYHPYLEVDMRTGEQRQSTFPLISGRFFDDRTGFFNYGAPGTCAAFKRSALAQIMPIPESLRIQADGYIGALTVFVAPVLAIQDCLATYRFHDTNLYHADDQSSLAVLKKRMEMTDVLVRCVHDWLREHGYSHRVISQSFVGRISLWHEANKFRISPPGRLRYFSYLMRENYVCSPVQTWKYTAFKYLAACSALLMGFDGAVRRQKRQANALAGAKRAMRALGVRSAVELKRSAANQETARTD